MIQNKYLFAGLTLALGIAIGWFMQSTEKETNQDGHNHNTAMEEEWTCSMHPQIRQNAPGSCPICGMNLIPVDSDSNSGDAMAVKMSPTAMKLSNIETAVVSAGSSKKSLTLNGKVQVNETLISKIPAHFHGRIEKLYVNFTGEKIKKGQLLAEVYSPELVNAQKELQLTYKDREVNPILYQSARKKLENWKIAQSEINKIEKSDSELLRIKIHAHHGGIVLKRNVAQGDHVQMGDILFEIANLSNVWLMLDVYESDIQWVATGDRVQFTVASFPGKSFEGQVTYLDPFINPQTRVAKARVEVPNKDQLLKPEMFASGMLISNSDNTKQSLTVPKSAVMWTGTRSVVYIKSSSGNGVSFVMREVTLSPSLGEEYVVLNGLEEGEEIAVNGTFNIDAAAQLAGKPSMMNSEGGATSTGHNHGGIDIPKSTSETTGPAPTSVEVGEKVKPALDKIYKAYFAFKDALVTDDARLAKETGASLQQAIKNTDMSLFSGQARNIWMKYSTNMLTALEHIAHFQSLDEIRPAFQKTSTEMLALGKSFGPGTYTIYVQHCPMANTNKGADWLSLDKEIKNPYFGAAMLGCGEITSTLK